MRTEILSYLDSNFSVSGFDVTQELPWDSSEIPLYLKNFKKIYVDRPQTVQEPLIDVLNHTNSGIGGVVAETTTVTAYVVTDAKTLPTNYDTMVSTLKNARFAISSDKTQRTTIVATSFEGDALVTEFNFNFYKVIIN
jgi:hypothetical protein